jgi:hypothetical protein
MSSQIKKSHHTGETLYFERVVTGFSGLVYVYNHTPGPQEMNLI